MRTKTVLITLLLSLINNVYAQNNLPFPTPQNNQNNMPAAVPQVLPSGLPFDSRNMAAPAVQATKGNLIDSNNLQFNTISLNNLLNIIFSEILTKNYVLSPKVIQDERLVSFRYTKKSDGDLLAFMNTFLKSLNYSVTNKNNILYVEEIEQKKPEDYSYYVYTPKYRTGSYLSETIRPYFSTALIGNLALQTPNQNANGADQQSLALSATLKNFDVITFKYDNDKLKDKILSMLNQLDKEEESLIVKTHVFEVTYNNQDGSAIGLMVNLASSKLNMQIGPTNPLDNFVKFSSNVLGLFLSNIDTDSRIKLVASPVLRVKNNKESSFVVGNSVPTLGSISYQGASGTPVQSVEYKDTGLTFKITPTIKKDSIDIDLTQEISDVQITTTGVNNSPTLIKRNLKTIFGTKKNEIVMLAGLTQNKESDNNSRPFILPFFNSKNNRIEKSDIVIFLEVVPAYYETSLPQQ
jgi:general secretion pathway protein D